MNEINKSKFTDTIDNSNINNESWDEPDLEQKDFNKENKVSPMVGLLIGIWYCIICAGFINIGVKQLTKNSKIEIIAIIIMLIGVFLAVVIAVIYSRKYKLIVAILSPLPWYLFYGGLMISPINFDYKFTIFGWVVAGKYFELLCIIITLITAIRAWKFAQNIDSPGNKGKLWWLWIPMSFWMGALPLVIYYLWLEIVTTIHYAVHPWLTFRYSWGEGMSDGLMPGMIGIVAFIYGINISYESINSIKETKVWKRVGKLIFGTVGIVGFIAPWLTWWGITQLIETPMLPGTTRWWILPQKEVDQKIEQAKQALIDADADGGSDHLKFAKQLRKLGGIYIEAGQYGKAESSLLRSLEINEKSLGLNNPEVTEILKELASLYLATGRKDEAAKFEKRVETKVVYTNFCKFPLS